MARTKGMLNLSGNLEVNAGAPLDARTVVPTLADLTIASNFQYKYVGMPVVVQATGDMYILTANDVTVAANWKKVGSGGGGSSYTAGDGIVIDNDEISTDNMPAADMAEIVTPLPSVMSRLPILFDETGAEQVVGWYRYSNGTKKPVYEKTIIDTIPATSAVKYIPLNVSVEYGYVVSGTVYLIEEKSIQSFIGVGTNNTFNQLGKISVIPNENTLDTPNSIYIKTNLSAWVGDILKIVVRYTKTTDTPV